MKYFLSIVIPCYNEQNRIKSTVNKITTFFSKKEFKYELILVDDGSTDTTVSILKKFIKKYSSQNNLKISILLNEKNKGKGHSVKKGFLAAKGKYVLFTDADLSTPIEEFENLLKYIKDGFNVAIASRSMPDSNIVVSQPLARVFIGKSFGLLVRWIVGLNYIDTQCGFKCFDRTAVDTIFHHLKITGFSFDVEILYLAKIFGLKVKEVPVRWENSFDSKVRIFIDPASMFFNLFRIKNIHSKTIPKH